MAHNKLEISIAGLNIQIFNKKILHPFLDPQRVFNKFLSTNHNKAIRLSFSKSHKKIHGFDNVVFKKGMLQYLTKNNIKLSKNINVICDSHTHYEESIFNIFNYLLINNYQGLMLHAAALKIGNKVFVLFGKSGAGKSTISKLCYEVMGKDSVLSDDIIIIRKVNGKLIIYGAPWVGAKTNYLAEYLSANISTAKDSIKNIYFLRLIKGKKNAIVPMGKSEKISTLIDSIFPGMLKLPAGSKEKAINRIFEYFHDIPIKTLIFKKDRSIIDFLRKIK